MPTSQTARIGRHTPSEHTPMLWPIGATVAAYVGVGLGGVGEGGMVIPA